MASGVDSPDWARWVATSRTFGCKHIRRHPYGYELFFGVDSSNCSSPTPPTTHTHTHNHTLPVCWIAINSPNQQLWLSSIFGSTYNLPYTRLNQVQVVSPTALEPSWNPQGTTSEQSTPKLFVGGGLNGNHKSKRKLELASWVKIQPHLKNPQVLGLASISQGISGATTGPVWVAEAMSRSWQRASTKSSRRPEPHFLDCHGALLGMERKKKLDAGIGSKTRVPWGRSRWV